MAICAFKTLFNQQIFSAVNKCSRLSSSKLSKLTKENNEANVTLSRRFAEKHKQYCWDFLGNNPEGPVKWETLEKGLTEMKTLNIRSTIFQTCRMLEKKNLAIDYCQYLLNKGATLSVLDISLFIRVLGKCDNNLENLDKLLKKLFDQSQDTIFAMQVIAAEAVKIFSKNESCFKEILQMYNKGELNEYGVGMLIAKLFDFNEAELAWKISNENPNKFSHEVIESYFKFCIRLAEENKFSINLISDFINFTRKHSLVVKSSTICDHVAQLVDVLNKSETERYTWSFEKCEIESKQESCSFCFYKFKPVTVTPEELEELKKNLLQSVLISRNINMNTTPTELNNYLKFLESCKPYDIVIDLLNLIEGNAQKMKMGNAILSFFEKEGMRILLIARHHLYEKLNNKYRRKYQIFLTRNDSLDDLFCLYAAMNRGLGTFICTSDFLRDHAKFFHDIRLNNLFHKWQISHQYSITNKKIVKPRSHSDMSQYEIVLTDNEVTQYRCHLSYLRMYQNYRMNTPVNWICLRAKSKKSANAQHQNETVKGKKSLE